MILTLVILPFALLVFGFPVFVVLLSASVLTLVFFMDVPASAIHQNLFGALNSVSLLAVPFFIFAGELMSRGSVASRLVGFVRPLVSRLPGALGVTTVGTATVFGAISGASAAAVVAVGKVMHKPMVESGYPTSFSAGLITSTSAIGIVIPPSIPMIIYGASAETSIPRLYAAGVFPGLLLALALAAYVTIRSGVGGFGATERHSLRDIGVALGRAFWALGAPVIVLGGIYGGIFSPTEAAAVACVYAILVTQFIFGELGWRDILESASATVMFTGQILVIAAAAGLFSWLLTVNQIPMNLVSWIASLEINAWQFLLAVNLILLLWGCFMDPLSAILLLTPLLIPLVDTFGIDRVHFGIVMTLNLAIGLFTPPFGINIFVGQSVLGMKLSDMYSGSFPFLLIFLFILLLITIFPQISLSSASFFLPM